MVNLLMLHVYPRSFDLKISTMYTIIIIIYSHFIGQWTTDILVLTIHNEVENWIGKSCQMVLLKDMICGFCPEGNKKSSNKYKKQLNKIEEWSRDGRAKKYTNKIYGENHIHYTSLRLLFSHLLILSRTASVFDYTSYILWVLTLYMWEKLIHEGRLLVSWLLHIVLHPM